MSYKPGLFSFVTLKVEIEALYLSYNGKEYKLHQRFRPRSYVWEFFDIGIKRLEHGTLTFTGSLTGYDLSAPAAVTAFTYFLDRKLLFVHSRADAPAGFGLEMLYTIDSSDGYILLRAEGVQCNMELRGIMLES